MAWGIVNVGSGSPGGQKEPLGLAQGGTGADNAPQALANLGAMPQAGGTFTGNVCFGSESYYIQTDGTANFAKVLGDRKSVV